MLNLLGNFLRTIDFVAPEVQLRTFGITRFKTIFGGLISFSVFGVVVVISLYFAKILIFRRFMWIVENESIISDATLHEASGNFAVAIVNEYGQPIENSSQIFNMTAVHVHDFSMVPIPINLSYTGLILEKCSSESHLSQSDSLLGSSFPVTNFFCISDKDLVLHGNPYTSKNHTYISFIISECTSNCLSPSIIQSTLNNSYLIIRYLDNEIDHFNATSDHSLYVREDVIPISTGQAVEYTYFYRSISYDTDYNWFYFEATMAEYYKMERRVQSTPIVRGKNNNLMVISFKMSERMTYYLRNYHKFQDALANIGGILESIMFIACAIQHHLTKRINYLSIANEIISFGDKGYESPRSPKKGHTFYEKNTEPKMNNFTQADKEAEETKNKSQTGIIPLNICKGNALFAINITQPQEGIYNDDNRKQKADLFNNQYPKPGTCPIDSKQLFGSSNLKGKRSSSKRVTQSLFGHVEKQVNQRFKIGSETNNIELSLKEILCDRFAFQKSKNIKLLEKAQKYINEKISVEFILKKLNEIDKLKFVLFNGDQLNMFHCIPNPNFNEIFSESETVKLKEIDNLWRKYEFYQSTIEEENDSYGIMKANGSNLDVISKRILSYVIGSTTI